MTAPQPPDQTPPGAGAGALDLAAIEARVKQAIMNPTNVFVRGHMISTDVPALIAQVRALEAERDAVRMQARTLLDLVRAWGYAIDEAVDAKDKDRAFAVCAAIGEKVNAAELALEALTEPEP